MKQNEISLNSLLIDSDRFLLTDEEIGDNHVATSIDTPMREDAFDLSDLEKIKIIEGKKLKLLKDTSEKLCSHWALI